MSRVRPLAHKILRLKASENWHGMPAHNLHHISRTPPGHARSVITIVCSIAMMYAAVNRSDNSAYPQSWFLLWCVIQKAGSNKVCFYVLQYCVHGLLQAHATTQHHHTLLQALKHTVCHLHPATVQESACGPCFDATAWFNESQLS